MRRPALLPSREEAWAALPSAALFALAFPPFPIVLPAFLCLVPFSIGIARLAERGGTGYAAARIGFWFGFIGYALNLYWIAIALSLYTKLAILGYIAALFVMAPVVAAAGSALFAARRATLWPFAVLLPVVWVASEVVINYMSDLAFPWLPLGLATADAPILAQIADLSGVRGVSFWIALTSGLVADAYLARRVRRAIVWRMAAVAAISLLVIAYGAWRLRTTHLLDVAAIAIVQPNIPQEEKWQAENEDRIVGILASLTREGLRRDDARLVVWPEVALPGYLVSHPEWQDTLRALAAVGHTPILFGVLDVVWRSSTDYEPYNAAMLTDSTGAVQSQGPYRKEYLVPVVERVPFVNPDWFAGLKYFGGFGRGEDQPPFRLPFGDVGVLICYESIFPQLSREYRLNGAELLINITNDAWFGETTAPYQHESHLALRAIENRVGIVRSANTGISSYVDPLGKVHGATELNVPATVTFEAQTTDVRTLYVRFGDWLGMASLVAVPLILVSGRLRRRDR